MQTSTPKIFHSLFSFIFLGAVLSMTFALMPASSQAAAPKKDRAVKFMEKVADQLIKAVRSGKKKNLEILIRRHADLKGIGTYSLGKYAKKLPSRNHPKYHRGVAKFMARYFMDEAKKYQVTSARVKSPSYTELGERLVETVVKLKDGSEYDVIWRLTKHNRKYKIRDIRILGLWLVPYQRDLFSDFVNKRNGNVHDLVIALQYN